MSRLSTKVSNGDGFKQPFSNTKLRIRHERHPQSIELSVKKQGAVLTNLALKLPKILIKISSLRASLQASPLRAQQLELVLVLE